MIQHGAYTLLIDSCYDREEFPTIDDAMAWTWASTKEEREAVEFVLSKFFTLQDDGKYIQKRIAEEINLYHEKCGKNKAIAIARETVRANDRTNRASSNTNRVQVDHEPSPNQEPVTSNHKEEEKTTRKQVALVVPDDVSQEVWQDFLLARKSAKAQVTDRVVAAIRKEAELAGWTLDQAMTEMVARGWRGFKAEWVQRGGHNARASPGYESERDIKSRTRRDFWEQINGKHSSVSTIIDIDAVRVD